MIAPAVQFTGVVKNYAGLRPLRLSSFEVHPGERVAIVGLDAGAAEVFVNLVTGATLPDAGSVRTFGRSTADISDGDEWLSSLDRFGIVSPRAVLLEGATLQQNLALPFTLDIDPIPPDVIRKVAALASECGIDEALLGSAAGELSPEIRARVHLGRAVALEPQLLIMEHPTAGVPAQSKQSYARTVAAVAESRRVTTIAATMDEEFAAAVAHRSLALNAATGVLTPWSRKRRWL